MFEKTSGQLNFPAEEEKVLGFWREKQIFAKSLEQRRGASEYVFYDGPPFATGLPHYGNLLPGTIKDVVPRYQTMCGKFCDRVFGWDCHGLPVENEVEQSLGINSKHEIEEYGITRFNEACRSIVDKYSAEWQSIVQRMGRWVDFERGYRTMDRDYMESIWWVFKQLWDRELVYEGNKVMWYCPRCATPLSNFEVNQGYAEVQDPAITVRFRVQDAENSFFLAWTTTPWTLPANLALAVGPDIDYVEVDDGGTHYFLAEALLNVYFRKEPPPVVRRWQGRELAGMTYEPLFDYFAELREAGAFRVINTGFVSITEGTGIVHVAPGFGEEDAIAGQEHGLPSVCPLDDEGHYTSEVRDYAGRFVKDCDEEIIKRLEAEGKLVHRGTCRHNYPHCWRCDSPLLNKAIATWFVRVEKIKDRLIAANELIHWVPGHLKAGRFGKWLANARDWAVSRNRYWGCPLPIWHNRESGQTVCIGSIAELEELSGRQLDDIHKHFVDEIVLPGKDGCELRRVPEVLDCWFESGAMPYAQRHYPFANREWLEDNFPADFIAEGLDQTRGWFYTLVVLGAALFDKPPFRNVLVHGLILAEDGSKMSKRKKNYPDPMYIMNTYGADPMRLYMLSTPVVRGEDLKFSETSLKETMRSVLIPFWNAYSFFVTYARVDNWRPAAAADATLPESVDNPLDQWIISCLEGMIKDIRDSMDKYELQPAANRFGGFVEQLSNWYIRCSRRRFWKSQNDRDKNEAYATLYYVLLRFCQAAAPFIPFITEAAYRNLRHDNMPESVHLCDFPRPAESWLNAALDRKMARARTAVSLGRFLRSQAGIRVRQPLRELFLVSLSAEVRQDLAEMQPVIATELNVKSVSVKENEHDLVRLSAKANFPRLGPKLGAKMKAAAAAIAKLTANDIDKLQLDAMVCVELDDEAVLEISKEDIEICREEKAGLAVANESNVTVALDLNLDAELALEGTAREIIHVIQEQRKVAQLEVTDRIRASIDGSAKVKEAVQKYHDYIAAETLAETLDFGPVSPASASVRIGPEQCRMLIAKV